MKRIVGENYISIRISEYHKKKFKEYCDDNLTTMTNEIKNFINECIKRHEKEKLILNKLEKMN